MFHAVYPLQRRPLLVRTNVPYSFTTLAVDLVDAVDGRYEVLFLGTGMGSILQFHLGSSYDCGAGLGYFLVSHSKRQKSCNLDY